MCIRIYVKEVFLLLIILRYTKITKVEDVLIQTSTFLYAFLAQISKKENKKGEGETMQH